MRKVWRKVRLFFNPHLEHTVARYGSSCFVCSCGKTWDFTPSYGDY